MTLARFSARGAREATEANLGSSAPDETSPRYAGWRVVSVCFLTAMFAWALGFYGQSVYLAELRQLHGWTASEISTATTCFYLVSAMLVVFVGEAIRMLGPRRLLAGAVICMALATALLGLVSAPWQLYAVYALMSFGWAGLTVAAISNTLGLWFDRKRGLAISLALNGASIGGVVGVPVLVFAIGAFGFKAAVTAAAALMAAILLPVILLGTGHPPQRAAPAQGSADAISSQRIRSDALRSPKFWTITLPFALVLLAQVGFIVHQISFMEPLIGRDRAGLAVSLMTVMAVTGRVLVGMMIDRLDQRVVSAVLFVSQALAIGAMVQFPSETVLFVTSAVFGFTVGNAITLPAVIVHHEFDARQFGVVVSLSTAISSTISACGSALVGLLHDLAGSYAPALYTCMALEIVAAIGVLSYRGHQRAA
jgi:predicted MFS family arabinose efflux permease